MHFSLNISYPIEIEYALESTSCIYVVYQDLVKQQEAATKQIVV